MQDHRNVSGLVRSRTEQLEVFREAEHSNSSQPYVRQYRDLAQANLQRELVFSEEQTHGLSRVRSIDRDLTSDGLGWNSAFVSKQHESPYKQDFSACKDPLVAFVLNGPVLFSRTINGLTLERKFVPGSFGIVPSGASFEARNEEKLHSMHVYVRQTIVEEIAAEICHGDPAKIEIVPQFAKFDQLLEQLAIALCDVAKNSAPFSSFLVDHYARTFAARLVSAHSTASVKPIMIKDGLDARQLRTIKEYIDAHIADQISLSDLARQCNFSPNHFSRLFKTATGLTPYLYLLQCRMELAQRLLTETKTSIAQISYDCGFGSQTAFTKAFRRLHGISPGAYRTERS